MPLEEQRHEFPARPIVPAVSAVQLDYLVLHVREMSASLVYRYGTTARDGTFVATAGATNVQVDLDATALHPIQATLDAFLRAIHGLTQTRV